MSYILDALRRADAERERKAVPGLHAQQLPMPSEPPPRGAPPLAWIGGGLVVIALAVAWLLADGDEAPPPAPATTVASLPPPAVVEPAAPAPRAAPTLPPIVPIEPVERPRAPRAATPAASMAAAAPASAAAPERVPTLQELPEALRRQIPPLSIGGSIYSENAASRFLVINGQVVHEGNPVAPDLVLERIQLKSAVLRFKGQRFGITW